MRDLLTWIAAVVAVPVVALAAASWAHACWGVLEKGRRAAVVGAAGWTLLAFLVVANAQGDGVVGDSVLAVLVAVALVLGLGMAWVVIRHARRQAGAGSE